MPVTERNTFNDGSTIALIAELDSFLFKGKVIENDVLVLKKGMKIKIIPTSQSNYSTEATIRTISPKGHREQGSMKYDIEAIFTLPDSIHIYSGFNAIAEFIIEEKKGVITIPEDCLMFQNDSVFVNILIRDEIKKAHAITGLSDGINIEIKRGVKTTDKVITPTK